MKIEETISINISMSDITNITRIELLHINDMTLEPLMPIIEESSNISDLQIILEMKFDTKIRRRNARPAARFKNNKRFSMTEKNSVFCVVFYFASVLHYRIIVM